MRIKEENYQKAIHSIVMKIYDDEIPATKDIEILIHAAEKQIGKKVVLNNKYNSYRCPCCDKVVGVSEHYCSQCGQKLNRRNKDC